MSETPRFCGNCGAALPPGGRFCGSCGQTVIGPPAPAGPPVADSPAPAPPRPAAATSGGAVWAIAAAGAVGVLALGVGGAWFAGLGPFTQAISPTPTPIVIVVPGSTGGPTQIAAADAQRSPSAAPATATAAPPTPTAVPPSPTVVPPTATPRLPSPTAVRQPSPTPAWPGSLASGPPVFTEAFSDNSRGWDVKTDGDVVYAIKDSSYRITVTGENLLGWAYIPTSPKEFKDFAIEMDATSMGGPEYWDYGVLFRCSGKDDFYRFGVNSAGRVAFFKRQDEKWTRVVDWKESPAVKKGRATNNIRIAAQGDTFVLYVNNSEVIRASDPGIAAGRIGIYAGTLKETGAEVGYDNIRIWSIP